MAISTLSINTDSGKSISRYSFAEAIEDLQDRGTLSLANVQKLSYADLSRLCEEIKRWSVYGHGDPKQLGAAVNPLS